MQVFIQTIDSIYTFKIELLTRSLQDSDISIIDFVQAPPGSREEQVIMIYERRCVHSTLSLEDKFKENEEIALTGAKNARKDAKP